MLDRFFCRNIRDVSPFEQVQKAINRAYIGEGLCVDVYRSDNPEESVVQICNLDGIKRMFVTDNLAGDSFQIDVEDEGLQVRSWPRQTLIEGDEGNLISEIAKRFLGLRGGNEYKKTLRILRRVRD